MAIKEYNPISISRKISTLNRMITASIMTSKLPLRNFGKKLRMIYVNKSDPPVEPFSRKTRAVPIPTKTPP